MDSACPEEKFEEKWFSPEKFSVFFFLDIERRIITEIFGANTFFQDFFSNSCEFWAKPSRLFAETPLGGLSNLDSTCSKEHFDERFVICKKQFFYPFRKKSDKQWLFVGKISARLWNCIPRVHRNLLMKSFLLWGIVFFIISEHWAKEYRLFLHIFWPGLSMSKLNSRCPKEYFDEKLFLSFFASFSDIEQEFFRLLLNNFRYVCQNYILRVMGIIWGKKLENFINICSFLTMSKKSRLVVQVCLAGWSKICVFRNILMKNISFVKVSSINIFRHWARKSRPLVKKKLSRKILLNAFAEIWFYVFIGPKWGKKFFFRKKNFISSDLFQTLSRKIFAFRRSFFGGVVKIALYVSIGISWG